MCEEKLLENNLEFVKKFLVDIYLVKGESYEYV